MLCFLCLVFVVFWVFFSITEENKQSLLWWGLPVLLLCCSCFICRTERSAHRALPAGPRRLHVGNLEPEEVEQKPKGLEERRAVPNAKELKSHRLSLPTRHLCMALWQSLPLVWQSLALVWHQEQTWLCPEELCWVWSELELQGQTHRTKMDGLWLHSIPGAHSQGFEGHFFSGRNLRSESRFPPEWKSLRKSKG